MKIASPAFEHGGRIPQKYACDGENINPPLTISDVPPETVSLVLIMDDPDVPKNIMQSGVFDHWLVWDMPASTAEIAEGMPPVGVTGPNSRGDNKYTGPCPPDREHRYFFKIYALDTNLAETSIQTRKDLETAMEGHILDAAELIGTYPQVQR